MPIISLELYKSILNRANGKINNIKTKKEETMLLECMKDQDVFEYKNALFTKGKHVKHGLVECMDNETCAIYHFPGTTPVEPYDKSYDISDAPAHMMLESVNTGLVYQKITTGESYKVCGELKYRVFVYDSNMREYRFIDDIKVKAYRPEWVRLKRLGQGSHFMYDDEVYQLNSLTFKAPEVETGKYCACTKSNGTTFLLLKDSEVQKVLNFDSVLAGA